MILNDSKQKKFLIFFLATVSAFYSYSQVGINTTNPTETLHVEGTFRLVNGSEGNQRVLTSDANGVGRWENVNIRAVSGTIGRGTNVPSFTSQYLQTESNITLPPGRWVVNVTMLMSTNSITPDNSSFWLRTSFSDTPGLNPVPSSDLVSGRLVSDGLPASSSFKSLTGSVIIENTSGADKTYHYIAGDVQVINTAQTLFLFGGTSWDESTIVAFPIN